jgi:cyclohexa-1,5-dienecarbonyl-CoA hydratase
MSAAPTRGANGLRSLPMSDFNVDERGGALWLTLHRPPLNVLDIATLREIRRALKGLPTRHDLKVLVIRSALAGTFSAGTDVRDHRRERVSQMLGALHRLVLFLDQIPQVTLAAVDGRCLGGGCELALFCDLVLATPRSTFALPEIDLGCFPPVAAVWLPRLAGRTAHEMVLLGEPVSAEDALRRGLINRVVDDLETATADLVARLAAKSGSALALARRAVRQGLRGSVSKAIGRTERMYLEEMTRTRDSVEGVEAFLEKRRPRWSDR